VREKKYLEGEIKAMCIVYNVKRKKWVFKLWSNNFGWGII
jgi:hypothetical protein